MAGAGYFSLVLEGQGRTIVPVTVQGDFAAYTLEFFASGASANPALTAERTNTNLSDPVTLDAGTWDLHVTAYMDAEKTKAAARGNLPGIVIGPGATVSGNVTLRPLINNGEGTFSWNISFENAGNIISADMIITPLDAANGEPVQIPFIDGEGSPSNTDDSLTLNTGYYRVVFKLTNNESLSAVRREVLHIYQNMESAFACTFTDSIFTNIVVTSGADSGPGSLSQAIADAYDGEIIIIDSSVGTIALTDSLEINNKGLTIEGNGVTITRGASQDEPWVRNYPLLRIGNWYSSVSVEVNISRVHFKDARANPAIDAGIWTNSSLVLESCIFSRNHAESEGIINIHSYGNTSVKGCTFYENSGGWGGVIYNSGGELTLAGNLFYGNITTGQSLVVSQIETVTSNGYNVVDIPLGTESAQSGWAAHSTDKQINNLPVSPVNFKLVSGSGADGIISALPADYPAVDFYGNPINAPASAGAVQAMANGNGYDLSVTVNTSVIGNSVIGSVEVTPQPDAEGFYPETVTLTAIPETDYELQYWLVDGSDIGAANPLELTLTGYNRIQAVFVRIPLVFIVDNFTDADDSYSTPGTLRHALANALDGDTIRMSGVIPGQTTIALTGTLTVNRNLSIEGNGVTITRDASWTTVSNSSQLLYIRGSVVNISRIHFKDGRAMDNGPAIGNYGNLNMESCIFSGNWSRGSGGAIRSDGGNMSVKGCTFYGNTANYGGAIYNGNSTLTLEGNLFYGNTATYSYPVVYTSGTVTSNSYNIVDVPLGTNDDQSGWTAHSTDKQINSLPISFVSFRLLSGSGAANVITTLPEGYPSVDFYGDPITNGASAGAVQTVASGSGYVLELTVNNSDRGSVNASSEPDADGLIAGGMVTLTANPVDGYELGYWLQDGTDIGNTNPLNLNITTHTKIQAVFIKIFTVDNFTDASGSAAVSGTLRHALANAIDGDIIRLSGVQPGQTSIALTGRLPDITAHISIEGNGVIITRDASWAVTDNSQFMSISITGSASISRIHFKDGKSSLYSAAIYSEGNLNMDSCIFSGNTSTSTNYGWSGGAIYSNWGELTITGCTFYQNSVTSTGGAICCNGDLTLTGNLFYGNTADYNPVIGGMSGRMDRVTSNGYNVVDVAMGTGEDESGWTAHSTDIQITTLPVVPGIPMPVMPGIITTLPVDYPALDFYGNAISAPAAAGAVQSGGGYYLEVTVNNTLGTVTKSAEPDGDGLYTPGASVTLTANAQGEGIFSHWLVNGEKQTGSTLPITMNASTFVQAVFIRAVTVSDSGDSNTSGTLRYALNNAQNGDIISINLTAPDNVIKLANALPNITSNITIEGNGAIITGDVGTAGFSLLNIGNGSTASISRIWFKDSSGNFPYGALQNQGNLSLESCIFSGNQSDYYGGAVTIISGATLDVKGCTFYGNTAVTSGGAIFNNGRVTLTGNLFYGNTAGGNPVAYGNNNITSLGYNVVDVPMGTDSTESGWNAGTRDTTFTVLGISGLPFNTATFAPVSGLDSHITSAPADFPETDFYGEERVYPCAPGAVK